MGSGDNQAGGTQRLAKRSFLLDRSDIFQMDMNLDDHTISIIAAASLHQALKIEKALFPETFPDPVDSGYFKVNICDVYKLRQELGLR